MKKLLSIFLFSFLLSNCSSIAVIGGTSLSSSYIASDIKMIFDVVSLVETGKSTNDHVLSAMVDKDCNLFGLFKNGKVKIEIYKIFRFKLPFGENINISIKGFCHSLIINSKSVGSIATVGGASETYLPSCNLGAAPKLLRK